MSLFSMSRVVLLGIIDEHGGEYAAQIHRRLVEHRNDNWGKAFLSSKPGATYAALDCLERDRLVSRRHVQVGNGSKYVYWITKKGLRIKAELLTDLRQRIPANDSIPILRPPLAPS